jgi:hypothetical protein
MQGRKQVRALTNCVPEGSGEGPREIDRLLHSTMCSGWTSAARRQAVSRPDPSKTNRQNERMADARNHPAEFGASFLSPPRSTSARGSFDCARAVATVH